MDLAREHQPRSKGRSTPVAPEVDDCRAIYDRKSPDSEESSAEGSFGKILDWTRYQHRGEPPPGQQDHRRQKN